MLGLTKEEAIRRHRLMWNWIAQASIQEQRCVQKVEALRHFEWNENIQSDCWCCEYAYDRCKFCPIKWPGFIGVCFSPFSPFSDWRGSVLYDDYIEAAKYAYQIAELPEKR